MKKKLGDSFEILFYLILISAICFLGYKLFYTKNVKSIKEIDSIKEYGYSIKSTSTPYEKKLFKELKTILNENEVNKEEYAKKVSQLFLTDLFTLSNKVTNSDIGGIQYVYSDYKDDYISIAQNGLYKNIKSNVDGNRNQDLPEVTSTEVTNITKSKFTYDKKEFDSFVVTVSISYKIDLEYPEKYEITLINNNNKLEVAKAK